jgi:FPC/CPF motif-containing protein YcgG
MMLAQDHAGSSHTATGDRTVTEGNLTFPPVRGSDELLYKFTGSLRHPEAVSELRVKLTRALKELQVQ